MVAKRILSEITGIVFSDDSDAQFFMIKCGSLKGLAGHIRYPANIPSFNQPPNNPFQNWINSADYIAKIMGDYQRFPELISSGEPHPLVLLHALVYYAHQSLGIGKEAEMFRSEVLADRHLYEFISASHRTIGGIAESSKDFEMAAGFLTDEFSWLGNVGINDLVELRRENTISELRSVFLSSIRRLADHRTPDRKLYAQALKSELEEAFRVFEVRLKAQKLKIRGKRSWEAAGLFISGVLGMSSLVWPDAAVISAIAGGSTLYSYFKTEAEGRGECQAIQRSPLGVLFQAYAR